MAPMTKEHLWLPRVQFRRGLFFFCERRDFCGKEGRHLSSFREAGRLVPPGEVTLLAEKHGPGVLFLFPPPSLFFAWWAGTPSPFWFFVRRAASFRERKG